MFEDDFDSNFEDLRPAREEENDDRDMDDLFAGFSNDVLKDVDDPFASLDEAPDDDLFSHLEATAEDDQDAWREPVAPAETVASDEPLPPLPDAAVPEWLSELGIERDEIVEDQLKAAPERDTAEPLTAISGSGPKGMAFGMTAQQRMILSIFLFLDVAVLGFLLLYALGVIQF